MTIRIIVNAVKKVLF